MVSKILFDSLLTYFVIIKNKIQINVGLMDLGILWASQCVEIKILGII